MTDIIAPVPMAESQLLISDNNNNNVSTSTTPLPEASTTFAKEIINLIGHDDLSKVIDLQEEISDNLRLSCEALTQMNDFAGKEYAKLMKEYQKIQK